MSTLPDPPNSLVFHVILIYRLGSGLNTQALVHLPLKGLTVKSSFCFLWVEDLTEIELNYGILKRWGFRVAEVIVAYDASVFDSKEPVRKLSPRQCESVTPWNSRLFSYHERETRNLTGIEILHGLGLSPEEYHSLVPHDSCTTTSEFSTVSTAHPQPSYSKCNQVSSTGSAPELFRKTARHSLMGIRGTVQR